MKISQMLVKPAEDCVELDQAGDVLAGAVKSAYDSAGECGPAIKNALSGTWLGHPLHPAVTDIPIGAWTAALCMDILGEPRGAAIAIGVGLAGALASAATGLTDWVDVHFKPRRVGVAHAALNGTATLLYAASLAARPRAHGLGVALSMMGYGLVSLGALYGGTISLDLQAGVNHAHGGEEPEGEIDVAALEDVPDGGMHRVDAAGYPVLLARRGSQVHAIAAVCAHQGGPLEKGKLEGDVVTCPWHGSQFCVRDGSNVRGPSAYPQPAFRARISGDRVLIQPTDA